MLHTKKYSNKIYSSGLAIHRFALLLKMPINNYIHFLCKGFLPVYLIPKKLEKAQLIEVLIILCYVQNNYYA